MTVQKRTPSGRKRAQTGRFPGHQTSNNQPVLEGRKNENFRPPIFFTWVCQAGQAGRNRPKIIEIGPKMSSNGIFYWQPQLRFPQQHRFCPFLRSIWQCLSNSTGSKTQSAHHSPTSLNQPTLTLVRQKMG